VAGHRHEKEDLVGFRGKEALRAGLALVALVLVAAPAVVAAPGDRSRQLTADGAGLLSSAAEPPPEPTNLPGKQENLAVVGQLQIPGVRLGQIADLAVYKGFAYLNSWDDAQCRDGGTYVVDIRNPASPSLVTFIPADQPYYHGEGAHVISVNTPAFRGDILAVNNETFGSNLALEDPPCNPREDADGDPDNTGGGFDLYDVSNPANPVPLVRNAGDMDPDNEGPGLPRAFANSYHSVFVWQNGPRAFLVASDNIEFTDVDIFDITNPRAPVQIGDHDLVELFPQILDGEQGNGGAVFHHDVVVKQIGGRPVMKVDYWDAGYVQLDVTDPANPVHINDTTFSGEDPLLPGSGLTPEGNAHQGEFSFDNQFLLAADEDFAPFRAIARATTNETGTQGRARSVVEGGDNPERIANLPDGRMNGPSMFVGDGCTVGDPTGIPPAPADDGDPNTDDIALIERGGAGAGCGFADKFDNAEAQGWDGVIIFNQPRPDDGQVNMLTVDADGPPGIPGAHMRRVDALGSEGVLSNSDTTPARGSQGPTLSVGADFDGWGYAHLYDAQTAQPIDAFAIDEARDPRFASGFGDLSIHEFATDPTENLAYSSYYAGGIRVFQFSRQNGLDETGAWIADGGSNFWGVEQFTTPQGERLIAGSDRDFGLVILRYTGPGRALPPACSDVTVMVPFKQSANVPLTCSDPNGNPLTESTTSTPSEGTLSGNPDSGSVTFTHTGDSLGPAGSFGFKANDGAADSNTATASLVAVARDGGRCFNPFTGTRGKDIIVGSRFGDRIRGIGGADTLRARRGADCLSGGRGVDRLLGEGGNDRLLGNGAADRLFGGPGRDRMVGGGGNDGLGGRGGNDRLSGGRGPDRLNGGNGNDRLNAGGGTNRLNGGRGNDRLNAQNGKQDKVRCGAGQDRAVVDADDTVAGDCEVVL
jgi:Ca2+-binding RTX toxin-like protein